MPATYRDERVAGSWFRDTSVLRIDTISRHVRSAIGAPIQEVLLADRTVQVSVLDVVYAGQTLMLLLRWC